MAEIDTVALSGIEQAEPAKTGFGLTRRRVLAATSLAVAGAALPLGASASALRYASAVLTASPDLTPIPETPEARVERLAFELADALNDLDAPVRFATVYPTEIHSDPVLIADLQAVIEATSTVSQELIAAMAAHAAAANALLHACRATDAIARGHQPSKADFLRLYKAEEHEHEALMALCRHPVRNEPERQEKATYLLGLFRDTELEADTIEPILIAMAAPVTGTDAVGMPALFLRRPLRDCRDDSLMSRSSNGVDQLS